MSLSDRLRAAALERSRANEGRPDAHLIDPNCVIDLRQSPPRATTNVPQLPRLHPLDTQIDIGRSVRLADVPLGADVDVDVRADRPRQLSPCPACDGVGQDDLYDRVSNTRYFSCDECGHLWSDATEG